MFHENSRSAPIPVQYSKRCSNMPRFGTHVRFLPVGTAPDVDSRLIGGWIVNTDLTIVVRLLRCTLIMVKGDEGMTERRVNSCATFGNTFPGRRSDGTDARPRSQHVRLRVSASLAVCCRLEKRAYFLTTAVSRGCASNDRYTSDIDSRNGTTHGEHRFRLVCGWIFLHSCRPGRHCRLACVR